MITDCTGCGASLHECNTLDREIGEVCCDDCHDTVTCSHDGIVARPIEHHVPEGIAS